MIELTKENLMVLEIFTATDDYYIGILEPNIHLNDFPYVINASTDKKIGKKAKKIFKENKENFFWYIKGKGSSKHIMIYNTALLANDKTFKIDFYGTPNSDDAPDNYNNYFAIKLLLMSHYNENTGKAIGKNHDSIDVFWGYDIDEFFSQYNIADPEVKDNLKLKYEFIKLEEE